MLRVARGLDSVGLSLPAFRALERIRGARAPELPAVGTDGLPLPPAHLQILVAGWANPDFGNDGAADTIREVLMTGSGRAIEDLDAVLDFGVGCGRVARHWATVQGPRFHGCDYNPQLTAWCRENLPFIEVRDNELEPPLPYDDHSFDLVYAISVFTHLREELQGPWIDELRRVLRPGGLALFSVHGDALSRPRLNTSELADYEAGRLVVRFDGESGTNLCSAFHPEPWVRDELLDGWTILTWRPGGAPGWGEQDLYLARTPS